MPYIKKERKEYLESSWATKPGELNYLFTKEIIGYIREKGLSYQTINDIVGALECCKMEFIRRIVNSYEDSKIKSNGDVY